MDSDRHLSDPRESEASVDHWDYDVPRDLHLDLAERLASFPREPHLWMFVIRSLAAVLIRAWLRIYHRFEVDGRDNLPIGQSFILVANHQSHLDALALSSIVPLRWMHRVFPAAAADYFFRNLPRSAFSSIVINALPFDRNVAGAESLEVCRRLLDAPGNILVLFPEGTRSPDGTLGRFRSGIGRLVEGSAIPVVPCRLVGAHHAWPKGRSIPRPSKLVLHVGQACTYEDLSPGHEAVQHICSDLRRRVEELRGKEQDTPESTRTRV